MTDSENSQHLNNSDDDIYNNILEFNFEDELVKLEGNKETYKQEVNDLSEKVKELAEENKELKKSNEVMKKNLSTLLKTAQAEVQRKDSMIEELRNEIKSFTFKKNKNITKDKYTSTDDLEPNFERKYESEKQKSVGEKKRSKSYENWTSSDSERKSSKEKKKEFLIGKEENLNCDSNNKKSNYHRENSKTNSRYSNGCHDTYSGRHRERKSARYEYSSGHRKSYRENHLDHLKYDSFDKKRRHSRSPDRRLMCCRRNSKERKNDFSEGDRPSRRRRKRKRSESSERFKRSRYNRSHSRDIFRRSNDSSLEKSKTRSLDKDSVIRTKEQISTKTEVSDKVKNNTDIVEHLKRIESSEKRISKEDGTTKDVKSKKIEEKNRFDKKKKRNSSDIYSAKSPLDALYNDMIISRSSNHFSNLKTDTTLPESDPEESEFSIPQTTNECQGTLTSNTLPYDLKSPLQEDWTLSFKNERKNETKSMTLYSKRMMRKFSTEKKISECLENKEEKALKEENEKETESKKMKKIEEMEKEPGELTDDENLIENSKEFKELTKVASIGNEIIEKTMIEKALKETIRIESLKIENLKTESVSKESQKESKKSSFSKEESSAYNEVDSNKDEVIEFSPFKNNYKLIEISPIKPSGKEHILDFYNRRMPPTQSLEQSSHVLEEKTALDKDSSKICEIPEEKNSWENSFSEKDSETELKIIIPSIGEISDKQETKPEKKEEKELKKKKGKTEIKKSKALKKNIAEKKGQKLPSRKKIEKLDVVDKSQKRKRKFSEIKESLKTKKRKTEIREPFRKSTRSNRNSKNESESKSKPEAEPETIPEPKLELENKIKEDISSFEFFKPVTKTENSLIPIDIDKTVSTTTDYKMTAMMSVSGVVRLETPNKCLEKLNNLIINEQMIFNVLDSKNNSQFSPLIGSKCMEMTPRRMLKNDLMLTDSEDDSVNKQNVEENRSEVEQEEVVEEEEIYELSESENSECDSDSGASDFVDLL